MQREFLVRLVFDDECDDETEGEPCLPDAETVSAALYHSTAAEALSEATGCRVVMEIVADAGNRLECAFCGVPVHGPGAIVQGEGEAFACCSEACAKAMLEDAAKREEEYGE